jgi:hypothetical protein
MAKVLATSKGATPPRHTLAQAKFCYGSGEIQMSALRIYASQRRADMLGSNPIEYRILGYPQGML